jgi:hypothetical protein
VLSMSWVPAPDRSSPISPIIEQTRVSTATFCAQAQCVDLAAPDSVARSVSPVQSSAASALQCNGLSRGRKVARVTEKVLAKRLPATIDSSNRASTPPTNHFKPQHGNWLERRVQPYHALSNGSALRVKCGNPLNP